MRHRIVAVVFGALVLGGSSVPAGAQPSEPRHQLARAQALYSQNRVPEALQDPRVVVLEGIQGLSSRRLHLADACQNLGLSYLAREEVAAARTALIAALSLDRHRQLSPLVYSEGVLRLVEEARTALGGVPIEPASANALLPGWRDPGSLSVVAVPWVEVSVNGAPPVQTPFTITLPAGRHRLRSARPGYATEVIEIEIDPGEAKRLRVALAREES